MQKRAANTLVTIGALILVAWPTALLLVTRLNPDLDALWMYFNLHFWSTGVTALLAAAACGMVIVSSRSLRQTRLIFLALAFMSIAGIFSVHGLLTPGVIKHEFHAAIAVAAWFSIMAGAAFATLSVIDLPERVDQFVAKAGQLLFAWTALAIGVFVALSWTVEDWLNGVPTDERLVQFAFAGAAMAMLAFASWRYLESWLLARLPSQIAMAGALVLLLQVPPILVWGEPWHISWWTYHAAYGMAFIVLFSGWALEWRRAGSLAAIAEALSMRDAFAQLNRGRDREVIQLVDEIEAKDYYTLGHVHRVGAMAYKVGRELGLPPAQLRDVVLAAQMHDVGKVGTPDAILLKPGPLDDNEVATMREHTIRGGEIASRVSALKPVSLAVRAHHERYEGGGYPDGLAGESIPLAARIVSVADTYDAMTSTRPYREAMSHDTAISELKRVRGTQLDPRCVDAFLGLFEVRQPQAA